MNKERRIKSVFRSHPDENSEAKRKLKGKSLRKRAYALQENPNPKSTVD